MVMAINNAALLTQPTDISNLTASYRDGQKLRQEYDARQHQKALNDLMKIGDFNERLAVASQHKYAGALVPAVQQYEEARQKAALDNLKTSADIGKTFGETGKLNAETGKIGAETEDTQLKTAQGIKDYVSAAAVTQDPKVFGLHIGELYKRGLITESQTQGLLSLIVKDPENAAKVMQAMAIANPEIAKTFMPEFKTVDGGDKIYGYSVNKFTGEANDPSMTITKGTSPDVVHQGGVSERNNIRTTNATRYASDNSYNASVYGSDMQYKGTVYKTDSDAETKMFEINQKGEIAWAKNLLEQQELDFKISTGGNNKPKKSTRDVELENEYSAQLKTNATTLKELARWQSKIKNGELKLGLSSNALNNAANRLGAPSLGSNPKDYAEFTAFLKDLANKALRLNKGTQTDADYIRQLEGMIAGSYIPRDNQTANALLARMNRDIVTANKGIYNNLSNVKARYGEPLPPYGQGAKKVNRGGGKTNTGGNKTNNNNAKVTTIANKWFN
ncbi:hypothetical protein [Psychrobacter sp. UBA3962]|uniref:hypothetical protein n=1 Tax=Psychrobacter sp. UBA3962 TaxID=1947352 RepID=UPI0025D8C4E8|nr:hypothetical protein [Psychrobacter sp. UBA3962]